MKLSINSLPTELSLDLTTPMMPDASRIQFLLALKTNSEKLNAQMNQKMTTSARRNDRKDIPPNLTRTTNITAKMFCISTRTMTALSLN